MTAVRHDPLRRPGQALQERDGLRQFMHVTRTGGDRKRDAMDRWCTWQTMHYLHDSTKIIGDVGNRMRFMHITCAIKLIAAAQHSVMLTATRNQRDRNAPDGITQ